MTGCSVGTEPHHGGGTLRDPEPFTDRRSAGRQLAAALEHLRDQDVVVLGLPRGGVPVAHEVARALGAPLDVVVVRKLGLPGQPELAMGAVGEGGAVVLNDRVLAVGGVRPQELEQARVREAAEVERRTQRLRGGAAREPLAGRTALLVDDGIATGATVRAACQVVRALGAARVVVAAPVAPPSAVQQLREEADEVVCLASPAHFSAVGSWYRDFAQTPDDEVIRLLAGG